jgi:hypothetical protein
MKRKIKSSRRQFLSQSGKVVAGSVLSGVALSRIYASEDNTIRLALVGCGGRGSGAAVNALSSPNGQVRLVAMADLRLSRINSTAYSVKRIGFII